jgi:hypothetical protein
MSSPNYDYTESLKYKIQYAIDNKYWFDVWLANEIYTYADCRRKIEEIRKNGLDDKDTSFRIVETLITTKSTGELLIETTIKTNYFYDC